MTDKELLELAAKAAGIEIKHYNKDDPNDRYYPDDCKPNGPSLLCWNLGEWNPLTDDGDALRLAVKLGIGFSFGIQDGRVVASGAESVLGEWEDIKKDPYAATRRAIVRAAAEIGKEMK